MNNVPVPELWGSRSEHCPWRFYVTDGTRRTALFGTAQEAWAAWAASDFLPDWPKAPKSI